MGKGSEKEGRCSECTHYVEVNPSLEEGACDRYEPFREVTSQEGCSEWKNTGKTSLRVKLHFTPKPREK